MIRKNRLFVCLALLVAIGLFCLVPPPTVQGYVEAPHSLGQVIALSSNIVIMRVTGVDRVNNRVIFAKVRDLKGVHKQEEIRHNIGKNGFEAREWQNVMTWAEVGKEAVFFHNGSQSETCTGNYWYQTYGNAGDPNGWWGMTHGEPFLLRSFSGRVDRLISTVTDILAGKEVLVPCLVDGNKDDLKAGKARIQRLRASLKLQDYNAKRDFAGWGGEDFRRVSGMPGFTHISALTRVDPDAQSISALDFNGDGKPDLCLAGASRVALLQNSGESLNEVSLPGSAGARSAVWADYNGDGLPDLLLATPTGPKLYTNLGKGVFRDDSHLLPQEAAYNLTCAAWIDQNGDGKPDILLGNGWHGLRLYRNKGKTEVESALGMGKWHYVGPFPNGGNGFNTAYPPEKKIDLTQKYAGKGGQIEWKEGTFTDGEINNLGLFANNDDAVIYLYREIRCKAAFQLPISLGSDDGLAVWLNGKKLLSENVQRGCLPDQNRLILNLKPGKNELLLKVTQGSGDWAFYFKAQAKLPPVMDWGFVDVSDEVGLGANGIGSTEKGDTLTVLDLDGDGRADFLYGAGTGIVVQNTGERFVEVKDSGIRFETGQVGPVFGDYNGDGRPDLFVPLATGCKLFRNEGKMRFTDVTATANLPAIVGQPTCAAWGDVDNDGQLDLVIGCLRGSNRFFRNKGDGTFEDASEQIGLDQRVFNTQAICLVDLNGDGVLDLVCNNEGQDAVVLLGNPETLGKRTAVTLPIQARLGVTGSRVCVKDATGTIKGWHHLSGGDGRGGQAWPVARFALTPGNYRVEVLFSNGEKRGKEIVVATNHFRAVLDDKMPKME